MKKKNNLTFIYSAQQALFWAAYCCASTFAVAYLLGEGYKASQAGVILFCANFTSFLVQPFIASIADRSEKNLIGKITIIQAVLSMACYIIIMLFSLPKLLHAILFFIGLALLDMELPFLSSLVVYYSEGERQIKYGLGRGIGAIGFGAASLILGYVTEDKGMRILFPIAVTMIFLFILVTLLYPKEEKKLQHGEEDKGCSLGEFIVRYKWYVLSLVGQLFLAMPHLMMENYLIEIFTPLGGGSSNVGIAIAIATVVETLVLFLISKIHGTLGSKRMLIISGFSYIAKVFLFVIARSVWVIYIGQFLQLTTYSFLQPIQVYYANECSNRSDMVKAQALSTALWTVGCAFGNLLGGVLISAAGLKFMLSAALVFTVIGTVIFLISVKPALEHKS